MIQDQKIWAPIRPYCLYTEGPEEMTCPLSTMLSSSLKRGYGCGEDHVT